jgi:RNA polymerase sigma factor (sigma-70 family)
MSYSNTIPSLDQQRSSSQIQLSPDEQIRLVIQVQERIALLKQKKDGFTPDERRIILRGDRAFDALLCQFRRMIFSLIHRLNVMNIYTFEEMYEFGVIELGRAVMIFEPERGLKVSTLAHTYIRNKFRLLNQSLLYEKKYHRNRELYLNSVSVVDDRTPLLVLLEKEALPEQEKCIQIRTAIQESISYLGETERYVVEQLAINGESQEVVAANVGQSMRTVRRIRQRSFKKMSAYPRLRELAEVY